MCKTKTSDEEKRWKRERWRIQRLLWPIFWWIKFFIIYLLQFHFSVGSFFLFFCFGSFSFLCFCLYNIIFWFCFAYTAANVIVAIKLFFFLFMFVFKREEEKIVNWTTRRTTTMEPLEHIEFCDTHMKRRLLSATFISELCFRYLSSFSFLLSVIFFSYFAVLHHTSFILFCLVAGFIFRFPFFSFHDIKTRRKTRKNFAIYACICNVFLFFFFVALQLYLHFFPSFSYAHLTAGCIAEAVAYSWLKFIKICNGIEWNKDREREKKSRSNICYQIYFSKK